MSADYTALATQLNSLSGTTDAKIAAINALTVAKAQPMLISPSKIINAIVPADLAALTATQVSFLTLVLQGSTVDASSGTTVRAAIQNIFAGKTTTLSNLSTLAGQFDGATIPWWQSKGFSNPIDYGDVKTALNIPETSSP